MNHYDCLKVTSDAPAEVIRAAYRALAGKRHPDRQGGTMGRDDEMHIQMVAINAAYEVLINPETRAEYDTMLAARTKPAEKGWSAERGRAGIANVAEGGGERENDFSETRVDIDWVMPKAAGPAPLWPLTGLRRYLAAGLALLLLIGVIWTVWAQVIGHQRDKALSDQFALRRPERVPDEGELAELGDERAAPSTRPEDPALRMPTAADAALAEEPGQPPKLADSETYDHQPTVTELSRLSDEQLVAILPSLGELQPAKGSFSRQLAPKHHHPLDGQPLNLRADKQLIDPLALDLPKQ